MIANWDRIIARWTTKKYYGGKVSSITSNQMNVLFDDGDRITHRLDDIAAVFPDEAPTADQVNVATHIVSKWKGSGQYFNGFVTAKPSSSSYEVTFDDGDKETYTLSQLRILPDHDLPHNGKWGRLTRYTSPTYILFYTQSETTASFQLNLRQTEPVATLQINIVQQ